MLLVMTRQQHILLCEAGGTRQFSIINVFMIGGQGNVSINFVFVSRIFRLFQSPKERKSFEENSMKPNVTLQRLESSTKVNSHDGRNKRKAMPKVKKINRQLLLFVRD